MTCDLRSDSPLYWQAFIQLTIKGLYLWRHPLHLLLLKETTHTFTGMSTTPTADLRLCFCCNFQGQIELYTHMPVMRQLVETLHLWDFRVCGVFLIDSQFMVDSSKFFAGVLSALSAMIQLEVPHINVMSKMDLLNKKQLKDVDRWVQYFEVCCMFKFKKHDWKGLFRSYAWMKWAFTVYPANSRCYAVSTLI